MIRVYCLIDPRTDLPFYVGATKVNPKIRLQAHIAEATNWQPNYTGILASKKEFIRGILDNGFRPIIKTLIVTNQDKAALFEMLYYKFFTERGLQLIQSKHRFIYNSINATKLQK